MNKRTFVGLSSVGVLLFAVAVSGGSSPQQSKVDGNKAVNSAQSTSIDTQPTKKAIPACDGTTVTADCTFEGATYSTYTYHPAVPEKSHAETVTTYREEITGYCTLCVDGTYSPSCATGRGACSYHGGVAEWNAPVYSSVPVYSTKTVIDAPAQAAYYEKVVAQ